MTGPASSPDRIAIWGDGQMALALADLLAAKGIAVAVWSPFEAEGARLAATRTTPRLPGFRLAEAVRVTADPASAAAGATLFVNAIPTQYIRPVFTRLAPVLPRATPIVSVAKGIETESFLRPSEILVASLGGARPIAVLSGPTIAGELVKRQPAVMVAASEEMELAERVRELFQSPWTRIYSLRDVLGVELAGACKNVIAIAAGILDGLRMGTNAKSALLARGLAEMTRFGVALGAQADTFFGVAGVGDLATTCFSPEGRNRSFGEAIGRGRAADEVLRESVSVVEGVPTARAVVGLARARGIDMPISRAVHAILFEGLSPTDAVAELMQRASGPERVM
jgi:glycerol-3-phosphate dehydrogenase (NAD(P)+)